MKIIDTHAHIYAKEFDQDRKEVLDRAKEVGVDKILMPNINSKSIDFMLQVEQDNPGYCLPMMGLHPCYVQDGFEKELYTVEDWLSKREFVAVGEIGMDFYRDTSFKEEQIEAFKVQIDLAKKYNLPIAIHARNAIKETIELLEVYGNGLKGVFHCFSGTVEEAQRIKEIGFYLGIGGVVTFKNAGLDKVLTDIGLNKLILETDCPYLSPVPYRGKRNESSFIPYIVSRMSDILDKTTGEVEIATTQNAKELFSLD